MNVIESCIGILARESCGGVRRERGALQYWDRSTPYLEGEFNARGAACHTDERHEWKAGTQKSPWRTGARLEVKRERGDRQRGTRNEGDNQVGEAVEAPNTGFVPRNAPPHHRRAHEVKSALANGLHLSRLKLERARRGRRRKESKCQWGKIAQRMATAMPTRVCRSETRRRATVEKAVQGARRRKRDEHTQYDGRREEGECQCAKT